MNKMKKMMIAGVAVVTLAVSAMVCLPNVAYATDGNADRFIAEDSENSNNNNNNNNNNTTTASNGALDKVKSGFDKVNSKVNANTDLEGSIGTILMIVYSLIGIVAVVMIILGGVSYATSQGDPGKIKKGKDTILYGIIGLIIVLLAFAITQFVLNQLGSE